MKFFIKIFLVLLIFISNLNLLKAQPITWQRVYPSAQPDFGRDGIQTLDGGFIIVAINQSPKGTAKLLKLNRYGNEDWTRIIDSMGTVVSIQQSTDSNFIIAGDGNNKGIIIKTNNLGNLIWKKNYSINNELAGFTKVKLLSNNDYLLCGVISFPPKAFLVRTDSSGGVVWQRSFSNGPNNAFASDIIKSKDDHIYFTGFSTVSGHPKTIIGKTSFTGDSLWIKSYGSEGKGDAQSSISIIPESNTELFLTGYYSDFYSSEAHFSKIDSSGDLIFQNVLPQTNESNSMCKTTAGNFAIAGGIATTSDDILFLLLNRNGDVLSRKIFNASGIEGDFSESISETNDRGFIITGYTSFLSVSGQDNNIYVIKTDSIGNAPVSVQNMNNGIPATFKLHQNFPNPFNSSTVIKFEVSNREYLHMKIYDVTGKNINVTTSKYYNPGVYEISFDGSNFASGIYFYKLSSENYTETKKMFQTK